jgi:uncharacterized protein (TIGR03435 family)
MPVGGTEEQYPDMLRALLEERFHLVAHRAAVEQTAYALVVAKNGPKLKKPGELDRATCPEWSAGPGQVNGGYQICRSEKVVGDHSVNIRMMADSSYGPFYEEYGSDGTHHEYFRITMPMLVRFLQGEISPGGSFGPTLAPYIAVVDRTGLSGAWDVVLDASGGLDERLSSYSASLEKQGSRLERVTAPVEKLIIDKIDRVPAEN